MDPSDTAPPDSKPPVAGSCDDDFEDTGHPGQRLLVWAALVTAAFVLTPTWPRSVWLACMGALPALMAVPVAGIPADLRGIPLKDPAVRQQNVRAWFVMGLAVYFTLGMSIGKTRVVAAMAARMEPVIEAIEKHKLDRSVYPKTLDDLVPTYMSEVPEFLRDTSMSSVRYFRDPQKQGDSYFLTYNIMIFEKCSYRRKEKDWHCWD